MRQLPEVGSPGTAWVPGVKLSLDKESAFEFLNNLYPHKI